MSLLPKQQQGLTFISLLFVLGGIAVIALLILKTIPIYMDHNKVASALTELKASPDFTALSESEIRNNLTKRFNINYVNDVTNDDIKVVKHGNYVRVDIEYDTVVKLVGNLSLLAEFHDVAQAGQE